jgi:hypothetical protein
MIMTNWAECTVNSEDSKNIAKILPWIVAGEWGITEEINAYYVILDVTKVEENVHMNLHVHRKGMQCSIPQGDR